AHQRLLVREENALASARGRERRPQPRDPHDGRHHHVGAGGAGDVLECAHAAAHLARKTVRPHAPLELLCGAGVQHDGDPRLESAALLEERADLAFRRQRGDFEPVGMPGDDVERAGADAAGGTEYGDAAPGGHAASINRWCGEPAKDGIFFYCLSSSAANGRAASNPSMRSRTPPWPGRSDRLSLTPACLFISDSNKS